MKERLAELRKKAAALPAEPGIYIMKDREGKVIYVGKSRALRNRVGSYFVGTHRGKTERMVAAVYDFDTVLCQSEMEALTLENALIKQHAPYYNIKLKDAKSYPYLKLTSEPYPRVTITRDRRGEGEYFGPYPGMSEAAAALEAVKKAFLLPTCRRRFPDEIGRERPCLYADMGQCMAVCRGGITEEAYAATVRRVRRVLSGKIGEAVAELTAGMHRAAEEERFEEAARLRDTVAALGRLRDKQRVVGDASVDCDAIAIHREGEGGVLSLLSVREGTLLSKRDYPFSGGLTEGPDALFTFLADLYGTGSIPREILLDFPADEEALLEFSDTLSSLAGRRIRALCPVRGKKKSLCAMARQNARLSFLRRAADREVREGVAVRLASLLSLEVVPERIEAFDISEIGNEEITASMVVFSEGKKKTADYRLFRMKTTSKMDDYASMREAVGRRLSHIGDGTASLGERPDLILVDGGRTQVKAAREAMAAAGVELPLFGMVKDEYHKTRALTDGEGEISIATDRGIYQLIYTMQEEAHRFAVSSVRRAKSKSLRRTALLDIPGIGPKKAQLLLTHYGSLARIKRADAGSLAAVPGIGEADARRIAAYFEKETEDK